MEVRIPKQLDSRLSSVSKSLGFRETDIVERAILFYLDSLEKQLNLKKEFNEWDKLSDEALLGFEGSL